MLWQSSLPTWITQHTHTHTEQQALTSYSLYNKTWTQNNLNYVWLCPAFVTHTCLVFSWRLLVCWWLLVFLGSSSLSVSVWSKLLHRILTRAVISRQKLNVLITPLTVHVCIFHSTRVISHFSVHCVPGLLWWFGKRTSNTGWSMSGRHFLPLGSFPELLSAVHQLWWVVVVPGRSLSVTDPGTRSVMTKPLRRNFTTAEVRL